MESILFSSAALLQQVKDEQISAVPYSQETHAKLSVAASEKLTIIA